MTMSDLELAKICAATYAPGVTWAFAGPTFHATWTASPGQVVIACEGSHSLGDWLADFDVVGPATFDHPALGVIHAGFSETSDECFHQIRDEVRKAKSDGLAVAITGHSKGGANAEVLAAKLALHGLWVDQLVTFGTPRWLMRGNRRVPPLLPAALGASYRHFRDLVPEVPLAPWDHPLTRPIVEVGTGSALQLLDVAWMHAITSYVAALS